MGCGRFECADGVDNAAAVRAGQDIPAGCDGFHLFGLVAQGDAGDLQPVGLFLHAAGIGQEHAGRFFEGDDVEITDGVEKPEGGAF